MRSIRTTILCILLFLTGCEVEEHNLSGSLLFSSGGTIQLVNLETMKDKKVLVSSSPGTVHNFLTKYGSEKVVFAECDGLRKPNCLLKQLDLQQHSITELRSGNMPAYIAKNETLFFYDYTDESKTPWLMKASKDNLSKADKIIKFNQKEKGISWFDYTYPVVQISDSKVAFLGEDDKLQFYDLDKKKIIDTPISGMIPMAWKRNSRQLICMGKRTYDYHLLDLDTWKIINVPELDGAYGLVYVPSQDVILFGKAKTKYFINETSDLIMFKFSDKTKKMVMEKHRMSSGLWLRK